MPQRKKACTKLSHLITDDLHGRTLWVDNVEVDDGRLEELRQSVEERATAAGGEVDGRTERTSERRVRLTTVGRRRLGLGQLVDLRVDGRTALDEQPN